MLSKPFNCKYIYSGLLQGVSTSTEYSSWCIKAIPVRPHYHHLVRWAIYLNVGIVKIEARAKAQRCFFVLNPPAAARLHRSSEFEMHCPAMLARWCKLPKHYLCLLLDEEIYGVWQKFRHDGIKSFGLRVIFPVSAPECSAPCLWLNAFIAYRRWCKEKVQCRQVMKKSYSITS